MSMIKGLFPVVTSNDLAFPDMMFDNFFNGFENPTEAPYKVPAVDIEDRGDAFVMTMDLPGVAKEDIHITYKDDILTLTAKHIARKEDKDSQKKYIRRERTNHVYCRQFTTRDIKKEGIEAVFKDGVLTVTLPKADPKETAAAHHIEIK